MQLSGDKVLKCLIKAIKSENTYSINERSLAGASFTQDHQFVRDAHDQRSTNRSMVLRQGGEEETD